MTGLAGRRILILRPREQAERFARRITEAGGNALTFPTLEIGPSPDPDGLAAVLGRLREFRFAIFVSPSAVEQGLAALRARGFVLPPGLRVAAVGEGTGGGLHRAGVRDVIVPRGMGDSETLAALPELQSIAGQGVLIFRGEGGREWLAGALAARGARVEYAQCYTRALPKSDVAPVADELDTGVVGATCVWSSEAWTNFLVLLGGRAAAARRAPVFVPHPRVAAAVGAGGARVIVAEGGESGMLAELESYFAGV